MIDSLLTSGERIKFTRKRLRLRQKDITGGEVTRNYISMLESNENKLSLHMAKIISESFNKKILNDKIPMNLIDPLWLIGNSESEIIQTFEQNLILLKDCHDNEFEKQKDYLILLLNNNNLGIKYKKRLYDEITNHYLVIGNFEEHEKYTLEMITTENDSEIILENLARLLANYYKTRKFEASKPIIHLALNMCNVDNIKQEIKCKVYYNCALIYKEINQDECINLCEILINSANLSLDKKIDVILLKCEYFLEIKDYDSAMITVFELQKKEKELFDENQLILIDRILALCYLEIGATSKASRYIEKSLKKLPQDNRYIYKVYELKFLYCLKVKDNIEFWFNISIGKARFINDYDAILKLYIELFNFIKTNNDLLAHLLIDNIFGDIKNLKTIELSLFGNKIIKYFSKNKTLLLKCIENL